MTFGDRMTLVVERRVDAIVDDFLGPSTHPTIATLKNHMKVELLKLVRDLMRDMRAEAMHEIEHMVAAHRELRRN